MCAIVPVSPHNLYILTHSPPIQVCLWWKCVIIWAEQEWDAERLRSPNLYGSLINWVRWASSFFSLWDLWALSLHSCPHSSVVRFFIPSFSLVPPCLHFLSRVLISILSCKICFTLLLGSWQFLPCCLFSAQLVLPTWPLTLTPKWYGSTIIVCVCVSVPLFLVGWVSGVVLWVPHSWGVEQLLGVLPDKNLWAFYCMFPPCVPTVSRFFYRWSWIDVSYLSAVVLNIQQSPG